MNGCVPNLLLMILATIAGVTGFVCSQPLDRILAPACYSIAALIDSPGTNSALAQRLGGGCFVTTPAYPPRWALFLEWQIFPLCWCVIGCSIAILVYRAPNLAVSAVSFLRSASTMPPRYPSLTKAERNLATRWVLSVAIGTCLYTLAHLLASLFNNSSSPTLGFRVDAVPIVSASFASFASVFSFHRLSRQVPTAPACRHCGYCLHGLTEPRCPECGQAFDVASIQQPIERPME